MWPSSVTGRHCICRSGSREQKIAACFEAGVPRATSEMRDATPEVGLGGGAPQASRLWKGEDWGE